MTQIILSLVLLSGFNCFAQNADSSTNLPPAKDTTNEETTIYRLVEQQALPPGGIQSFVNYLSKHVIYPEEAITQNISGKVTYEFVVEKDGSLSHITILKDIGGGCGEAVATTLKNYTGKWKPGKINNHDVASYIKGNFTFLLNEAQSNGERIEKRVYFLENKESPRPRSGSLSFETYLDRKIVYPKEAAKAKVSGRVYYKFTVDTNGIIKNIKILKEPGYGCGEAVKKALEAYPKRWIPAKIDHEPVNSTYLGNYNFKRR